MFPALNELIGWGAGLDSIPSGSKILLGDSNPIDTLPFIYSFMSLWLKPSNTMNAAVSASTVSPMHTAIIFVSFKTAQNRILGAFRKLFGVQLNILSAQARFHFIDAVNRPELLMNQLNQALQRSQKMRTFVILEGFSWSLAVKPSISNFVNLHSEIESSMENFPNSCLLVQWSRDLEADYPGRNPVIRDDIRLGGKGWLYLLTRSHYVICVRPIRSGVSRDAVGEIVAALGLCVSNSFDPLTTPFHPISTLYKIPTDSSIQCILKGQNV